MTGVTFLPIDRPDLPALYAGPSDSGTGFVYQALDVGGTVHVETWHVSFADALRQVAQRMDCDKGVHYDARIEA